MAIERVPVLLLVEDSAADVKILQRALTQTSPPVELVVLRDGQEAADYLLRKGTFAGKQAPAWRPPDLIVLDLNLPLITGLEVLHLIRSNPQFCLTPVVILSMSRRPEDVRESYAGGANAYIEKPLDFDRFVQILRTVQQLWLEMAILPSSPPA
jgi:CheY-like chemotaxis protein